MKKKILLALSFLAVAGLSVGGTVAYFTAQHAEVNTFTYGDVKIEQMQYRRVVDVDGNWTTEGSDEDQYGYIPDVLEKIDNNEGVSLLPAVYQNEENTMMFDDRNGSTNSSGEGSHQQSWKQYVGAPGSNQLFDDSVKNVVDKFTFVKNTGNTDAYVRTWIAFEQGNLDSERYDKILHVLLNSSWWDKTAEITDYVIRDEETGKENKYQVFCFTFKGEDSQKNGILTPGAITRPAFLQFYIDPSTTGEEIKAMDGNNDKEFNVITITQAVQAEGFTSAENAFTKAFGTDLPF